MINDGAWVRFSNPHEIEMSASRLYKIVENTEHLDPLYKLGDSDFTVFVREYNHLVTALKEILNNLRTSRVPLTLTGKWMVFENYPIITELLQIMEERIIEDKSTLIIGGKIPTNPKHGPFILYTSNAVDFEACKSSMEYILDVLMDKLEEYELNKAYWYYKPDLFTHQGIYSGNSELKSYVYRYHRK